MMTNQFRDLFNEKNGAVPPKNGYLTPRTPYKMHFSLKSLQNRFTFGHILSWEVTWSTKNHMVKMVIEPWPSVRTGLRSHRDADATNEKARL